MPLSLRVYSAAEAEDGIKPAEKVSADVLMTQKAMINALVRNGGYFLNGDVLNNIENTANKCAAFTDEQNFVFDFKFKMSDSASGSLQIRLRAKDMKNHTEGYRIYISKNRVDIAKFRDDNWASKTIKSAKHSFKETTDVRIVANGSVIWIAVNGEKILEIDDAITVDGGQLVMYGLGTSEKCELLPVSLLKYSDAAANDGITEREPVADDDKPILRPLRTTANVDADTIASEDIGNANTALLIAVIVAAAVLVVGGGTAVLLILKKKKV